MLQHPRDETGAWVEPPICDTVNFSNRQVDELGKGTEVHDGTAFVGMVLENLDAVGCMGILATHLHGVLDMELRTRHVARMAMGTVVEDDVSGRPVRRATWKMVDGEVGRHLRIWKSFEANVSCYPT